MSRIGGEISVSSRSVTCTGLELVSLSSMFGLVTLPLSPIINSLLAGWLYADNGTSGLWVSAADVK